MQINASRDEESQTTQQPRREQRPQDVRCAAPIVEQLSSTAMRESRQFAERARPSSAPGVAGATGASEAVQTLTVQRRPDSHLSAGGHPQPRRDLPPTPDRPTTDIAVPEEFGARGTASGQRRSGADMVRSASPAQQTERLVHCDRNHHFRPRDPRESTRRSGPSRPSDCVGPGTADSGAAAPLAASVRTPDTVPTPNARSGTIPAGVIDAIVRAAQVDRNQSGALRLRVDIDVGRGGALRMEVISRGSRRIALQFTGQTGAFNPREVDEIVERLEARGIHVTETALSP